MSSLSIQAAFDDGPASARDKPTVVFLHAFPYHSAMWEGQRLALRGHARCVAFDARGVGTRRAETAAYMLEHSVDDLFALLDQLEIPRAVLCGLSMGGYAALRAIERAPERVAGLVLADTQAGADTDAAKLARADGVRMLMRDGLPAFARAQLKRQLSPHTQQTQPQLADKLEQLITRSTTEGVAASAVAISTRTDQLNALSKITVPTRIIVGAEDSLTPPNVAQLMAAKIAGADLHVIPNVGHLSNQEHPGEFNRLLIDFVTNKL